MSTIAIGHQIGAVPAVNFNFTTPRMFDLYQHPPQFQNYNQNLPLDMSNAPSHGNMQTPPEVSGHTQHMPNFHGHVQNSANIPFRNPNIPMNINQYHHNVPPINFSEQNHPPKPPPERPNHQNRNPPLNHPSVHRSDKKFSHRDESGHGWGGGGGGGGSVGNSPAISALALLGFLFFLNLIQNSLQNNRMMLTTTTTTTTSTNMTTTTTAGGSTITTVNGRSGRERRKRDSDYYSFHRYIPDSIPSHPIRPIQKFLENRDFEEPTFYQPIAGDSISTFTSPSAPSSNNYDTMDHYDSIHAESSKNSEKTNMNAWMPLMKRLKRISTNCCQLFACTLGRGIIKKYGKPTALMLRSIGRQLLPKTQTHWSTKILRALTNGWKISRKCSTQYNKCAGDWDRWLNTSHHHKNKRSSSVKMKN